MRLGNQIAALVAADLLAEPATIGGGPDDGAGARPATGLEDIVSTYEGEESASTALDGLSFRVGEAEFLALVRPSGSGKSTLLDIVGRLLTQDSGAVRLDGEPTSAERRLGHSAYINSVISSSLGGRRSTTPRSASRPRAVSRRGLAKGGNRTLALRSRRIW